MSDVTTGGPTVSATVFDETLPEMAVMFAVPDDATAVATPPRQTPQLGIALEIFAIVLSDEVQRTELVTGIGGPLLKVPLAVNGMVSSWGRVAGVVGLMLRPVNPMFR